MFMLKGESIYEGVISGPVKCYERIHINMAGNCVKSYQEAVEAVRQQTELLYQKMLREAGKEAADIFRAHLMILDDPDFEEMVMDKMGTQGMRAAEAICCAGQIYYDMLASMDDTYMRERAADVADVTIQLILAVTGKEDNLYQVEDPVILCTHELYPSEIAKPEKGSLLAVVTEKGSAVSHMAILARSLKIPTITGIGVFPVWMDGKLGSLDAGRGIFRLENG